VTYLDNHTHLDALGLDDQQPPVEEIVRLAALARVDTLIHSGTDLPSSRWAVEQAERFPGVWATVGYHPHEAEIADEAGFVELEALAASPKVIAMGETGLDFYRNRASRSAQEQAFIEQLKLAGRTGLPVVIHTREAAEDTLRVLDTHGSGIEVVLHCFSLPDRLPELAARGYYFSFAGNVTFKNAVALQAAVREVSSDRLLLETDAPYLAPEPYRGRRNSPALVVHTYEFVARERGTSALKLAAQVRENAARAYPRLRLE
jgi:TatD DNase family protein